jgi:outer membrane immunogenic protein
LEVFAIDNGNSPSGVIGGAHVDYQYQFNQFVVGIEGSVDGTSLRANAQFFLPDFVGANNILNAHVTSDVQGTVRGKLGFAWDRVLLHGTGGVAFGGFSGDLLLNELTSAGIPFPIARAADAQLNPYPAAAK